MYKNTNNNNKQYIYVYIDINKIRLLKTITNKWSILQGDQSKVFFVFLVEYSELGYINVIKLCKNNKNNNEGESKLKTNDECSFLTSGFCVGDVTVMIGALVAMWCSHEKIVIWSKSS